MSALEALWRPSLGSGLGPSSANRAQPIVHGGVLYIVTGDNDAFAIDVETGTVLWEYEAKIDEDVARPCCGWAARGVALGDGKVFVGQVSPAAIWERAAAGLTTRRRGSIRARAEVLLSLMWIRAR